MVFLGLTVFSAAATFGYTVYKDFNDTGLIDRVKFLEEGKKTDDVD